MINEWIRNKTFRYTVLCELSRRPQLCPDPSLKFVKLLLRLYLEDNASENERRPWPETGLIFRILAKFHDAHPNIQYKSLETIMHGLERGSPTMKRMAAHALLEWPGVEYYYFKRVLKQFESSKDQFRSYQAILLKVLVNWSYSACDEDLIIVAQKLNREYKKNGLGVMGLGTEIIGKWLQPSNIVVNQLCQNLGKSNKWRFQNGILKMLACWSQLSRPILHVIGKMLSHKDLLLRQRAFDALANQSFLYLEEMEPHMESLYQVIFHLSFDRHAYWLYENGKHCIVLDSRALRGKDEQGNKDTWFVLDPGITQRLRGEFIIQDSQESRLIYRS
ncbi:hypothetical protein N7540_003153 [Penicillium herquei]|nr:hypothetical protein N7540_003153 [Penicillium herquei]